MIDIIKGQVMEARSSRFKVRLDDGRLINALARGKIKLKSDIFVGDYVSVEVDKNGMGVIVDLLERKNILIRPYVSNIDVLLIVISSLPEPDLLLVDKLIVNANMESITPVICINKADLVGCDAIVSRIVSVYKSIVDVYVVSTVSGNGMDSLGQALEGKSVALGGQSAVGKSSIVNYLFGKEVMEIGELSDRIDRGKNTTRHVKILTEGRYKIYDTCGFSSFEFNDLPPEKLAFYYDDFAPYQEKCHYRGCSHIDEPDCAVKNAVQNKELPLERYDRYVVLYKELMEAWRKKYDK